MEKSLTPIFIFAAAMLLTARSAPRWVLQCLFLSAVAGEIADKLHPIDRLEYE